VARPPSWRKRVARAALQDADADVRLGAFELFRSVADREADAIVWELAQNDVALRGARGRRGRALWPAVVKSVAKLWASGLLDGDEPRDFVRLQATTHGLGQAVISSIARRDVEWLRQRFADVVRANPECAALVIEELFNALAYSGFPIEDVARVVAEIPGVDRARLRDEITRVLFGAARARVLDAIAATPTS
jgi:hypothetical protein